MVLLEFSDGRTDSSYSITTLGNAWTHVRLGWYYKVWQPIMNPPELLLKIFEANFEIYWEWSYNWCNFTASFSIRYWYICLFVMSQEWTMILTESINIYYVSVRVARIIKVNIKETFMANNGFLEMFILWMDCSQRIKDLFLEKLSIFSGKDVFLLLWEILNLS